MLESILIILGILIILSGFVGLLIPLLPDLPLVFAGALLIAFAVNFDPIGWGVLCVLLMIVVASIGVDFLAQIYGAKRMGASRWGIAGSIVGLFIGLFLGLPGMLIGPFVGAFVFEIIAGRKKHEAFKASIGTFVGFIGGIGFKIILGVVMIGVVAAQFI